MSKLVLQPARRLPGRVKITFTKSEMIAALIGHFRVPLPSECGEDLAHVGHQLALEVDRFASDVTLTIQPMGTEAQAKTYLEKVETFEVPPTVAKLQVVS